MVFLGTIGKNNFQGWAGYRDRNENSALENGPEGRGSEAITKPLGTLYIMYLQEPEVFYVMLPHHAPSRALGGSVLPQDSLVLTSAEAGLTGRIGRRYELVAKQILEKVTPESHKDSPRLSHCPLRDRPLSQDYLWVTWILLCGLRC